MQRTETGWKNDKYRKRWKWKKCVLMGGHDCKNLSNYSRFITGSYYFSHFFGTKIVKPLVTKFVTCVTMFRTDRYKFCNVTNNE